jgi:hypothetical protein
MTYSAKYLNNSNRNKKQQKQTKGEDFAKAKAISNTLTVLYNSVSVEVENVQNFRTYLSQISKGEYTTYSLGRGKILVTKVK